MKIRIVNESSRDNIVEQIKSFFYDTLGISQKPEIFIKQGVVRGIYNYDSSEMLSKLRRKLEQDTSFVDVADSTSITDSGWVVTYEQVDEPNFSVLLISNFDDSVNSVQVTGRYDIEE